MARPSGSWRWGSCQPRISQLPCQFLHTRNPHQSHRLWMFMGCWGLMLNARTCQGMRFKAQLLHLPSSTQSIQLSWPRLQFQRLHPLKLLNYRLMSQMQTRPVLQLEQWSMLKARKTVSNSIPQAAFKIYQYHWSLAGLVDSSSTSSDVITLTEEVYKNCLESVNGNEEGLADKEEESMQDALDSLDTAVIPGLVLGTVSSSGHRSRQPVYLQQYFLH